RRQGCEAFSAEGRETTGAGRDHERVPRCGLGGWPAATGSLAQRRRGGGLARNLREKWWAATRVRAAHSLRSCSRACDRGSSQKRSRRRRNCSARALLLHVWPPASLSRRSVGLVGVGGAGLRLSLLAGICGLGRVFSGG